MKKTLALLFMSLTALMSYAQNNKTPQLSSPLHLTPAPSGTFAEVRTNHFHGGLDLRIGGDEGVGTPVYAPADGFVSRLRISAYDGGKMLYIDHPGGITTVYLHLDSYHGAIAKYVRNYQARKQCYAFDTTIAQGVLPVHKGDLIAYAGNSGMSGGPHLHYEVRNTSTQQSLNPLRYGITLPDTIRPVIRGIRLLPVEKNTRLNGSKAPYQVDISTKFRRMGTVYNPIPVLGRFYISVYATDMSEGSTLRNGYERLDIWVDGRHFFQYNVDKITFGDTRAINAQLDYDQYLATREPYIITRRLPGDPMRPARTFGDGSIGFIDSDTTLHRITVAVTDFNGNQAVRCFYVRNRFETLVPMHEVPEHPSYHLFSDSLTVRWPLSVHRGDYQVEMPAGMLYYDDLLLHGMQKDRRYISPIYTVKPWRSPYPPHRTWQLRVPLVVGYEPSQLVVCTLRNDKLSALPTRIVERRIEGKPGRWLEADIRVFGNFVVASDTSAPYVKPLNFKAGGKVSVSTLRLKMGDNLSGVREYRCFINGEWVLGEFDGKTATLSIALDQVPKSAKNLDLRIFLTDCCGNAREVAYQLRR
ncbi:MAG: M23 family metallopeptidase [Bacteroidales bacterium]|nr:M23 family metallopeptidase [Bacteroidales bacterium]